MKTLTMLLADAHKAASASNQTLRDGYSAAIRTGDEFAALHLLGLITKSATHEAEVRAAMHAANMMTKMMTKGGKL